MQREVPGPGQESVWDYPRPPRIEKSDRNIQIVFDGRIIAQTRRAFRVLETSHPPTWYLPPRDVLRELLQPGSVRSFCEFKGSALYYSLKSGIRFGENAAWYYPHPTEAFRPIANHIAFYPRRVDACFVDGERVRAQERDFYGGWITRDILGPFKGGPGTLGW